MSYFLYLFITQYGSWLPIFFFLFNGCSCWFFSYHLEWSRFKFSFEVAFKIMTMWLVVIFQSRWIYCFGYSSGVAWAGCWSCSIEFCRTVWRYKWWNHQVWRNSPASLLSEAFEGNFPTYSSWIFVLASKATSSNWICLKECMSFAP